MKLFRNALVVGLLAASALARADFPDRPITLVVPFAAGGPSDKIARDLAEALRKPLGQTIIVDNTAGAGGTIGSARVARAKPDGYTLLVHHIGLATSPSLYRKPQLQDAGRLRVPGVDQRGAVHPDRQADASRKELCRTAANGSMPTMAR